jgi:electron transfer flavoprotein alpha subunit
MGNGAVVLCTWFGESQSVPEEALAALTLGRRAAESIGTDLEWLVLGAAAPACEAAAAEQGVVRIHHQDGGLDGNSPDGLVQALAVFCEANSPRILLFCQDFESRVVAPRLAGRVGAGVVMNGVEIAAPSAGALCVTASAYGGDTRVVYEFVGDGTSVVALQANAGLPEAAASPSTPERVSLKADLGETSERIRVVDAAQAEGPRLEEAEIIVSGGRGLGAQENYALIEELAQALGGMAGASRPLVDEGWTDASHQVGLTGRITRPVLYVAAGISGASQHMAGCGAAKNIAAINKDPDAAIFRYARYGIVGDCLEILPELIRAAKQAR